MIHLKYLKYTVPREFPSGPVVRSLHFHSRGHRVTPWLGK